MLILLFIPIIIDIIYDIDTDLEIQIRDKDINNEIIW